MNRIRAFSTCGVFLRSSLTRKDTHVGARHAVYVVDLFRFRGENRRCQRTQSVDRPLAQSACVLFFVFLRLSVGERVPSGKVFDLKRGPVTVLLLFRAKLLLTYTRESHESFALVRYT